MKSHLQSAWLLICVWGKKLAKMTKLREKYHTRGFVVVCLLSSEIIKTQNWFAHRQMVAEGKVGNLKLFF